MADKEQEESLDYACSRLAIVGGLAAIDYLLRQRVDRSIRLIDTDGNVKEVFLNG